jgi:3-deoxy-7-phosphoheptulonate synthase / chorismate mutase
MDRPTRSSSETDDESPDLERLRDEIELVNDELLNLLNRRARLVTEVQRVKTREGIPTFIPQREQQQLDDLVTRNKGPFADKTISHLFKEIFKASVALMERRKERTLKVSRASHGRDLQIDVGSASLGAPDAPMLIAGPCAVEDAEQMESTARHLASLGVRFIRGGAFKPRSSPYSFQGLGLEGLRLLQQAAERYGLVSVTEVMDTRSVELVCSHADILQIGSRNMYNYDLLREVGRCRKPVLLKRGLCATIDELLWAAEYIVDQGNERVILCERGIRTYERQTRNTLDISAVPLLRQKSYLPVIVDVSHAAGRKDILAPLGRAALAAGASGLMVEAHPCPALARSDSQQQLTLDELTRFMHDVGLPVGADAGLTAAAQAAAATLVTGR